MRHAPAVMLEVTRITYTRKLAHTCPNRVWTSIDDDRRNIIGPPFGMRGRITYRGRIIELREFICPC